MLEHAAVLADTKVRHYPLVETFDAWESWDVFTPCLSACAGASAYSHAAVKTPRGIKVPAGTYISWANQGKRLLSDDDVSFLSGNISAAVTDAHKVTEVYGPTLVYARDSAQWQADHARPDSDVKEWLDEQVGSIVKWPIPMLSVTRIEWLANVHSDLFILGTPSNLSQHEIETVLRLAKSSQPMAFFGSPAGGIDRQLGMLAGLSAVELQHAAVTLLPGAAQQSAVRFAPDIPLLFPVQQGLTRNTAAPGTEVLYSVTYSPALVLNTASGRKLLTWDPPEFADLCCKPLREIWGGSAAPYALTAGAINGLLHNDKSLHAAEIQMQQTFNVGAWKTSDGSLHILAGNLEEGLREDADMSRSATLELPRAWQKCEWKPVWSGGGSELQQGTLHLHLDAASSMQLIAPGSASCQ